MILVSFLVTCQLLPNPREQPWELPWNLGWGLHATGGYWLSYSSWLCPGTLASHGSLVTPCVLPVACP